MVGIGSWGRVLLRSFARKCEVRAIASTGNAQNMEEALQIAPYAQSLLLEEILQHPEIDAIVVAVPITALDYVGKQCIASGKDLFFEKPAAQSSMMLTEFLNLRERSQTCHVGYLLTHDPCLVKLRECIGERPIKTIRTTWTKYGTFGNDLLLNLVSHDLSQVLELLSINEGGGQPCELSDEPESTLQVKTCHLTTDKIDLQFTIQGTDVHINVDRTAKLKRSKSLWVKTTEDSFRLEKSKLTAKKAGLLFDANDVDLVDLERDRFLSSCEHGRGECDFYFARSVLQAIEGIRSCA